MIALIWIGYVILTAVVLVVLLQVEGPPDQDD